MSLFFMPGKSPLGKWERLQGKSRSMVGENADRTCGTLTTCNIFSLRKGISWVLVATLLLGSCFTLTGCHGSKQKTSFAIPETLDESGRYELTFWAKNDTNVAQTTIYQNAIKEFEELYPNVTINVRLYTDYGKIYNDVITNISTDTTPNVCITYPDHIATYMTGENTVVPLDDLFEDSKYGLGGSEVKFDAPTRKEMIPQFLEECKLGDYYYAVPFMRSTEACYINKTLLNKMGYEIPEQLTWDFIWEVSDAAMAKDADGNYLVNGTNVLIPFIYKSTDNMMIQYLKQSGAGYSTATGEIEIFNDTTTDFLKTIREHVGNGAFSTFKISSYPGNFLNAGQCIFAIDSTAGATWMGSDAPLSDLCSDDIVACETVVKAIPQVDPDNPKMISQGPSVCIFNKEDPQEVLYSWLFVQYLLTNKVQIGYSETEGYVPVTSKAQESEEYKDYLSREGEDKVEHYAVKIQAAKLLLNNVNNTFVTPVFNGSASLRDAAGSMIESVAKSVRRKQTVDDEYLKKLFDDVVAQYHLDQIAKTDEGRPTIAGMGALPVAAKALLIGVVVCWLGIGIFALLRLKKSKVRGK